MSESICSGCGCKLWESQYHKCSGPYGEPLVETLLKKENATLRAECELARRRLEIAREALEDIAREFNRFDMTAQRTYNFYIAKEALEKIRK